MNREDIILMADASGLSLYGMGKDREKFIHYLERFAALVASAEREACAYRAGIALLGADRGLSNRVDQAIRARGQA